MKNSLTDIAGLKVGCAHKVDVMTGVTVIVPDKPSVCAVDVRGGGPGARETDVLNPENLVDQVDAVVLSGGSVYGLAAADGVVTGMGAIGRGYGLADLPGVPKSPIVPAAILYDLANGGDKEWGIEPPYRALGAAAFDAVSDIVPLGNAGAGYGAVAGAYKGGQGTASARTQDGYTVGAIAAVNCFGSVTIPNDNAFWAWTYEQGNEFGGVKPNLNNSIALQDWGAAKINPGVRENTTIALVATDAHLTQAEVKRLAIMAQDGLARAIRPAHAPFDGDIVFALSTGAKPVDGGGAAHGAITLTRLGALAADVLARAIARGVYEAEGLGRHPAWRTSAA